MNLYRTFLEALPLMAALVSLMLVGKTLVLSHNRHVQVLCVMALCCTMTMMVAQVSWAWTYLIQGEQIGTEFADILWSLFNFWTMVTFAYAAHRGSK